MNKQSLRRILGVRSIPFDTPLPRTTTCTPEERTGPQFPFAPENDPQGERASQALAATDDLLHGLAMNSLRSLRMDRASMEDAVQRCRIRLWQTALPKFDAWRRPRVKVTTFIAHCAQNAMRDEYRRAVRERRRRSRERAYECSVAHDERSDRAVERIAAEFGQVNHLLTRKQQAAVVSYINRRPGQELKEVAAIAGYANPASWSTIVARAITRIKTLIDDAPIAT